MITYSTDEFSADFVAWIFSLFDDGDFYGMFLQVASEGKSGESAADDCDGALHFI